jgi:hypothetical protein
MNIIYEKLKFIEKKNFLSKNFFYLPKHGLSDQDIKILQEKVEFKFDPKFVDFLKEFNGSNLDVIRIFGVSKYDDRIFDLVENNKDEDLFIFASDPAGFTYAQDSNFYVFSIDSEGGETIKVAENFEDFICNYLFGNRSEEFGGEEWKEELTQAGII